MDLDKTAIIGAGTSKLTTLRDYFLKEPIENVEYHLVDTYNIESVPENINFHLVGQELFYGLGSAGDPRRAEESIKKTLGRIEAILANCSNAIFLAGLGGGTGTACLPILIDLAMKYETRFHCFASMPFVFEGAERQQFAKSSLQKVKTYSNKITTIDQIHLMSLLDGKKYQSSAHLLDLLNRAFVWKTMDYLLN